MLNSRPPRLRCPNGVRVCLVGRRVIKGRGRSDNALRLLARWFLVLFGAAAYHQYSQDNHYQEQLRAACAFNFLPRVFKVFWVLIAHRGKVSDMVAARITRGRDGR